MTRPRGIVPIRIAYYRARELARWLRTYQPLPPALLCADDDTVERQTALLSMLVEALEPKKTGRRRATISTYYLPRMALKVIDNGHAALSMPRKLRPIVRHVLRSIRLKKGPKITPAQRQQNIANGYYEPETVRRYIWAERKEAKWRLAAMNAPSESWLGLDPGPPKPGSDAYSVMMVMAAHRWLI